MRTNNILGVVFANVHDDLVPDLTEKRSMASLPFAGRYRLVDFALSNLVNAGISQVGVITKENYQSLMDHLGNGKSFDLDRNSGGLFILPPFAGTDSHRGVYHGHIGALAGIQSFLKRSKQEYVVICDCDVISNIDIVDMFNRHLESGADFTIAYKRGKLPKNHEDIMTFEFNGENTVTSINFPLMSEDIDYSLDITIVKKQLLLDIIAEATAKGYTSLSRHFFAKNYNKYKICGYKVEGFAEVMDSADSFYQLNMKMLEGEVRKQLFNTERPVYTKTHVCMPTRYGLESKVHNSLIADGCVIKGNVKNCIIFRNVTVEEGATVENSIIMQGTVIGKNATVKNVITDKQVMIEENLKVEGQVKKALYIKKGEKVTEDKI